MRQVGPDADVFRLRPNRQRLPLQEREARGRLRFRGRPPKRAEIHAANAVLGRSRRCQHAPRPHLGLLMHKRVIQQNQRLGRHVRHAATADGGERDWRVEGEQQRRQEVAAHREVDAAAAGTVQRTARGPAAAVLKRRQIDRHGRPLHRAVQPAAHGQQRVADRLALQPPHPRSVQPEVVRIGGVRVLVGARRHPVRAAQHHGPDRLLERPAVPDQLDREVVEQFGVRRRLAEDAEVIDRGHDAPAEQVVPEPVDDHARDERVAGRVGHLARQF